MSYRAHPAVPPAKGRAHSVGAGLFMLLVACGFVVVPTIIHFDSQPGGNLTAQAAGQVTRIRPSGTYGSDGRLSNACGLDYVFEVAGQEHTGRSAVSSTSYCRYQVGDGVDIRYDPASPDDSVFVRKSILDVALLALQVAVGLTVCGFGVREIVLALRARRQPAR
ncbi:MAG: DUF3592 domain-containing protein [Bifidobacteriaceae bacterium]|jgi:hypothetical protein|nr:DUF3592 domain-containing protein [Bifidobacteriaceae bacterium]